MTMYIEADTKQVVRQALENIGVYAPGEMIADANFAAGISRLDQMLDTEFLAECLAARLAPAFGVKYPLYPELTDQDVRLSALQLAEDADGTLEGNMLRAREFVEFIGSGPNAERDIRRTALTKARYVSRDWSKVLPYAKAYLEFLLGR